MSLRLIGNFLLHAPSVLMSDPIRRDVLETVLGRRPTRSAVRRVVDRCHRMACAYLRQQQASGALREDVLGEEVEDLAMDAIAELFERDERGRFPELRRYFSDRDLEGRSPEAVDDDLRRLVVGAVTDWLFEAYRAADRSLSNLIRNLKRVIDDRADVSLRRRGRTLWVEIESAPVGAGTGEGATSVGRSMPMDMLEAHLTGAVADNPSTSDLLDIVVETLHAHPEYRSAYPLTRLAQVLRAARVRVQAVTDHDPPVDVPDAPLLQEDEIEEAIEESLVAVRKEKHATYVESGKIDEKTYMSYFLALHDRLEARFVPPGDDDMTHYDALARYLNDLSQDEYRSHHRSRFEDLEQCAREQLVHRLREVV